MSFWKESLLWSCFEILKILYLTLIFFTNENTYQGERINIPIRRQLLFQHRSSNV